MLGVTNTHEAITSGMNKIAEVIGGGIRPGSLVIIEGESGSGKSVLSQHLVHDTLNSKEKAIAYYTTDFDVRGLINQMNSLSLSVLDYFLADRLRIYPVKSGSGLYDVENARESLYLLINHISSLPERFNIVVLDSVTPIIAHTTPRLKMDFLHTFKELCEMNKRSVILIVNSHAFEKKALTRAYALSDYYMEVVSDDNILNAEQMDDRVIKTLRVLKLHGAERGTPESVKFEVKPGVGIQILPFAKVRI